MKKTLSVFVAAVISVGAFAEMQHTSITVSGNTNATVSTLGTMGANGLLYRLAVTVNGTASTNNLILADTDGTVIWSNSFVSGTTTTNLATPIPFVGIAVKGFSANKLTVTNTVTTLNLR